jgi:hypothetical protein
MTSKIDQLYAALDKSRSEVPYAVIRTDNGFRVELDLYTPAVRQHAERLAISQTFSINVKLDEGKQKAKLRDTLKEVSWGPGYTHGFQLGATVQSGLVLSSTYSWSTSKEDNLRAQEMKPFAIKAAKAWVRQELETNNWKCGGIGALFG